MSHAIDRPVSVSFCCNILNDYDPSAPGIWGDRSLVERLVRGFELQRLRASGGCRRVEGLDKPVEGHLRHCAALLRKTRHRFEPNIGDRSFALQRQEFRELGVGDKKALLCRDHAHAMRHVVDREIKLVGDPLRLGAKGDLAKKYVSKPRSRAINEEAQGYE